MRLFSFICASLLLVACSSSGGYESSYDDDDDYSDSVYEEEDWDYGYEWAEDNDPESFDDCQYEFGTSEAEDGCNEYVQDNHYYGEESFHGYPCTEDCSGHIAGYEWAEQNDISDIYHCNGKSQSFDEGCEAYVEENY